MRALREEAGGELRGIVLDLRNNPGGLLSQAVKISDLFLDSGLVVYTEGRLEGKVQKYPAHQGQSPLPHEYPMVVLVNGGSASASEIVAGALQDHKRALVLGTQTFGKGSVQTILPLADGQAAIRLTTARYFTPNGRSIQATGITPDIIMEPPVQVATAGKPERPPDMLSERNLPGHLEGARERQAPAQGGEGERDDGGGAEPGGGEVSSVPAADQSDPMIERALELLKSWSLFKTVVAQNPQ